MGPSRRAQTLLLMRGDFVQTGSTGDEAGPNAGGADPLGELPDEDLRDLIDGALPEIDGDTQAIGVQPSGANDVEARALGNLSSQLRIAPQLNGTGVNKGGHAQRLQLAQA